MRPAVSPVLQLGASLSWRGAAAQLVGCLIGGACIDKVGRRPLVLFSLCGDDAAMRARLSKLCAAPRRLLLKTILAETERAEYASEPDDGVVGLRPRPVYFDAFTEFVEQPAEVPAMEKK